jgi:hypothetical protein
MKKARRAKTRAPANKELTLGYLATAKAVEDNLRRTANHEEETDKFKAREDGPAMRSLASIRTQALNAHADVAHTIAELEAWRNEIDATLAFLRSTRPA